MTHNRDNEILLELKYCERCGALFFRTSDSDHRLCRTCTVESATAPLPVAGPARNLPPQEPAAWYGPMTGTVERLQGVASPYPPPADTACGVSPHKLPSRPCQSSKHRRISGGVA